MPSALAMLLGVLTLIGTPGRAPDAIAAEQRVVDLSPAPVTFAEVVRAARLAVVTLRLPGSPDLLERRISGGVAEEPDEAFGDEALEPEASVTPLEWHTLGAAVIVDPTGIALTTARLGHLGPGLDVVMLDGRRVQATVVGVDEPSDLAVLRLRDSARPFPHLALANSDETAALDSVRYVLSGAAPLPIDVGRRVEDRFGVQVVQGYGMTEASPLTHSTMLGRNREGTVGPPVPDTEEKIVDAETGTREMGPEEPGGFPR